jgi:cell division protein FtsW (lipid II flippase)
MSRSSALILLGILVVVAPLSGLPESWITFLLAVFGIIIALIGIAMRAAQARRAREAAFVPATLPVAESSPAEPEPIHAHHDHHHPSAIS